MKKLDSVKPKKENKILERVTISDDLKGKLSSLCSQANEALQGVATVTKSDITNLILKSHSGTLSKSEIETLKAEHFDELRFANWLAAKIRDAREAGESVSLKDLFEKSKPLMENMKSRSEKRKQKQKKKVLTNKTQGLHAEATIDVDSNEDKIVSNLLDDSGL